MRTFTNMPGIKEVVCYFWTQLLSNNLKCHTIMIIHTFVHLSCVSWHRTKDNFKFSHHHVNNLTSKEALRT